METLSTAELLEQIVNALNEADGKYIERIANQILDVKVKYVGDSSFEISSEKM